MNNILIVEDEDFLIQVLKDNLATEGCTVDIAKDGEEAVEKVGKKKPDLILLDIILPGINGLELCRCLKANPETKSIPIIIVTASREEDLSERCLAAGADGLIIKPFEAKELLEKIKKLTFERVGQQIGANLICVRNSSNYRNKFLTVASAVEAASNLAIALYSDDTESIAAAIKLCKERRPLIICGEKPFPDNFIRLAKENNLPLALTCGTLEEAADATAKAKAGGVEEIVINLKEKKLAKRLQDFTYLRRSALKKNFRPLGYPIIAFTENIDPDLELAEAVSYVAKYAGIVIMKNTDKDFVFPLLVARQDIYQDPQKPVQVEPKIYEIGKVTKDSPVLITTNFSITYFTVAGEVESSKVPSYIICADAEGMSVLTAWAAEKFTAEQIAGMLKKCGIEDIVSHRTLTIPGYVAVLSGKLAEVSGWKISVGPREASGIVNYLRSWTS